MERISKRRGASKVSVGYRSPNHFSKTEIFEIVRETRDFEIEMFWRRTNYFLLLNSAVGGGLLLILAKFDKINIYTMPIIVFFSIIGCFVCLAWICIGLGGKYWQSHWEQALIEMQKEVGLTGKKDLFSEEQTDGRVKRSVEKKGYIYRSLILCKPSVSRWMDRTAWFFLLVWLFVPFASKCIIYSTGFLCPYIQKYMIYVNG